MMQDKAFNQVCRDFVSPERVENDIVQVAMKATFGDQVMRDGGVPAKKRTLFKIRPKHDLEEAGGNCTGRKRRSGVNRLLKGLPHGEPGRLQ